jgi:hypothetical protein
MGAARDFFEYGLMLKAGRAVLTGAFALTMAVGSIVGAAAAPQNSTAAGPASIPSVTGEASQTIGKSPTSLGHFFGKATSDLAHIVPAGPGHGKVVSAFAKSSNPSHTKGHHFARDAKR